MADYERIYGHQLVEACPIDPATGELAPAIDDRDRQRWPVSICQFRVVYRDPSRATTCPNQSKVSRAKRLQRTGIRDPEKCEKLYLEEIPDALALAKATEPYRI